MSIIQTGRPARWIAAGLAAAGLVLLGACSSSAQAASSTDGDASTSGAGGAASSSADRDAFASCLAENGVTLPEPPSGGATGGTPPSGAPQGTPPSDGSEGAPPAGGTPPAPEDVDESTWTAALEACQDLTPAPPTR